MKNIRLQIKNLIDNGQFPQLSYNSINDDTHISGFRDAHCHVWGLGIKYLELDLSNVDSLEDCLNLISNSQKNRGEWLTGRGWNQELWSNPAFPSKEHLDKIFPTIPVALKRVDGHAYWVNSRALELAGIDKSSQNLIGGEILKNNFNEPSGILIDNAMILIDAVIPKYTEIQLENLIDKGIIEAQKVGLSSVYDMDVSPLQVGIFKRKAENSELKIKIKAYISAQNNDYIGFYEKPFFINNFELAGVKFYLDGALGSRGAALLEPYSDDLQNMGLLLMEEQEFYLKAESAIKCGFEIATHVIGDRANQMLANVYSKLRSKYPNAILKAEHSQIIHKDDIRKFADSGIIASVQPIHCTSDAEMAIKRLGENRCEKNAYLWKTLLDNNIKIIAGSDFPIESHNPIAGIDAFVNRKSQATNLPFFEYEAITLEEALKAYID